MVVIVDEVLINGYPVSGTLLMGLAIGGFGLSLAVVVTVIALLASDRNQNSNED